jgi:hypothetical protein
VRSQTKDEKWFTHNDIILARKILTSRRSKTAVGNLPYITPQEVIRWLQRKLTPIPESHKGSRVADREPVQSPRCVQTNSRLTLGKNMNGVSEASIETGQRQEHLLTDASSEVE